LFALFLGLIDKFCNIFDVARIFVRFMAQLEVFSLLLTLQDSDHDAFLAYWAHPARQEKKLAFHLYTWLQAHPAAWKGQRIPAETRALFETIYPELYPGKVFKPQRIRRVLMELKEVLEDFLAQHMPPLIDPHLDRELRLLQYLLSRGAHKLFLERHASFQRYLETQAMLAPETLLARFWLEEKHNEYLIHHSGSHDTFEALNDALDSFYLSRKLENFAAMRARERYHPQKHSYALEAELFGMLAQPGIQAQDLPRLWQAIYQMQAGSGSVEAYEEARHVLGVLQPRLSAITLRQVYGYLFNYLVTRPDTDSLAHYVRLWELLRQMLSAGTLHMPDGRMTSPFFLQTLRVSCLAGQHTWAADFVAQVRGDLLKDQAADLLAYAEVLIGFYAGEAAKSWQRCLTFRPKDQRLETYTRILQVQLAYTLDKEDEFSRIVESLEKFIRRCTPLGARFMELVMEFARLSARIGNVRFGSGKLPKGLSEHLHARDTAEKLWLLEQLEGLQGG
jgi:hypothetical protein